MRLVFWQNMLSPHQLPYITKLPDIIGVKEVIVVAPMAVGNERKNMGWSIGNYDGLDNVKIVIGPDDKTINLLFKDNPNESWHLFSGIHADGFVFKCLKISMTYKLNRGMITERPNTYDFKHNIENAKPYWLHRIRFRLQDYKYAKQMKVVFAMGNEAVAYFKSVNKNWQVFTFGYCTQSPKLECDIHGKINFVFVGSLSPWKAPLNIIKALDQELVADIEGIKFIGNGPLYGELEYEIKEYSLQKKVKLLGTKQQSQVPDYLSNSDILILPSVYDGWGAVVNEALQQGCYVLVSDACGASLLPQMEPKLGKIFNHKDAKNLRKCMKYCIDHLAEIRSDRPFRKQWAEENISGYAIAKYMVNCLKSIPM